MSMKEMFEDDLENVFFDEDEFAEECSWDKEQIRAIIDDDDLIKKYSSEFEALSRGSHMIYAVQSQFKRQPQINEVHVFNNNQYTIDEIKREAGMLVIFLNNGRG